MNQPQNKTSFARVLRKNQTDAELQLWEKLRGRRFSNVKFRRQQPIGSFIVDFVSAEQKLVIEVDGGVHRTKDGKLKDIQKKEYLQKSGYTVLRFWNNEIVTG